MKVYCSTCKTVHVFPCDGIVGGYGVHQPEWAPVAESLSRRLDALEKQAGPVGAVQAAQDRADARRASWLGSGGSDSDSKDALIRDLMTWLGDHHVYPYVVWNDTKNGFRDRAEKLGVKL